MTFLANLFNLTRGVKPPSTRDAKSIPLRIMPLGASITYGLASSDGNGYREDLRQSLVSEGYSVRYVGSQSSGTMANPQNEGFPGLRIEEVLAHAKVDVPLYLPNLYLINLGTNDAVQNYDILNAGSRMNDLITYLWTATPGATIVLSTLLVNLDANTETRAQVISAQFSALATSLAALGKRIVLVDMHGSNGPQTTDMADVTHPNDLGYEKMAKIWLAGIEKASDANIITPAPNSTTDLKDAKIDVKISMGDKA